jgi:hypothetical protein
MSDPVTNVEIEDVLSSIRRLVSDDARAKPQRSAAQSQERLVLTPSLRVKEEEQAQPEEIPAQPILLTDPAAVPEPDSEQILWKTEAYSIDVSVETDAPASAESLDVIADAESAPLKLDFAALWKTDKAAEEETAGELVDLSEPAEADVNAPSDGAWDDKPAQPEPGPESLPDADITPSSALARLVENEIARALDEQQSGLSAEQEPEQDEAEPVQDIVEETVEAEPFEAAPNEPSEASVEEASEPEAPEVIEDTASLAFATEAHPFLQDVETARDPEPAVFVRDVAADDTPATSLETKIAALEQMVAQKDETYEADDDATEVTGAAFVHRPPETLEWQDHDPAEPEETKPIEVPKDPAPKAKVEKTPPTWFVEDASMIDEEMLRDMVSEIVRHELQGALGERITRNVRKLVRREIHRVLMSQEFD